MYLRRKLKQLRAFASVHCCLNNKNDSALTEILCSAEAWNSRNMLEKLRLTHFACCRRARADKRLRGVLLVGENGRKTVDNTKILSNKRSCSELSNCRFAGVLVLVVKLRKLKKNSDAAVQRWRVEVGELNKKINNRVVVILVFEVELLEFGVDLYVALGNRMDFGLLENLELVASKAVLLDGVQEEGGSAVRGAAFGLLVVPDVINYLEVVRGEILNDVENKLVNFVLRISDDFRLVGLDELLCGVFKCLEEC